ncbi:hypothetical protein [Flavobacterium sharifuzzamanii]|uniref:hypothetical protein n=1 Tax=Flavobacterium sharifuzzamanii TaxID=2211133 RepID=UPI000DABC430|nr:hypothetical protein [Flavobacterium sharifuzzamanii]KAF2079553.1 hypothetical protein DMA14_18595 [Flavobacterium sharifuzzamanii]
MARIFIGFMICFLFLNCEKKKEKTAVESKPYIISYEDRKLKNYYDSLQKNNPNTPPPPKGFYSESQLIIDKKREFYYYKKDFMRHGCGTTLKSDTIPHLINLKPNDLVKISQADLANFLSDDFTTKKEHKGILIIASQNDTIKNELLFNFLNKKNISFFIRKTTQEEDTVLKYKKRNETYKSENIKWDQNRITLPFIKPKLEKTTK